MKIPMAILNIPTLIHTHTPILINNLILIPKSKANLKDNLILTLKNSKRVQKERIHMSKKRSTLEAAIRKSKINELFFNSNRLGRSLLLVLVNRLKFS
mmetsp:Transcript_9062/g.7980  ORF Transcript_9062/g.7980 Transcript_9062/m.7980 type:complete len:98 (+) Transcript_9062:1077-1370(+)